MPDFDAAEKLAKERDQLNARLRDLIKGIRASYAQEFEPDDQSPVDDLIRHAFVTLADRGMKIRKLEAQLKESKANEAICHCGALLSDHTQSDNHGGVPTAPLCPNQPPATPTKGWFNRAAEVIEGYSKAGHFGEHIPDRPCALCHAASTVDRLRRMAAHLEHP